MWAPFESSEITLPFFYFPLITTVERLVAFLMALLVILLAFSQAFVTVFRNSDMCPESKANDPLQKLMIDKRVTVGMLNGVYMPWGFGEYDICDARNVTMYKFQAPLDYSAVTEIPSIAPSSSMAPTFASSSDSPSFQPSLSASPSVSPSFQPSWTNLADGEIRWQMSGDEYCVQRYKEMYCEGEDCVPFCDFWNSFIRVYTMLIGEVDETEFSSSSIARAFYVIFAFLVVILLANVLIAIVTDSYGVIRNQRAEIVFWTNRLDFLAEIGSIWSGVSRIKAVCTDYDDDDFPADRTDSVSRVSKESGTWEDLGGSLWTKLVELFNDEELGFLSLDFWCYSFSRLIALFVILPVWLVLGFATAGWLWPPQVRKWLFVQKYTKRRTDALRDFHNESNARLANLKNDNAEFRENFAELGGGVNRLIDSLRSY
mmetsp:Transcript_34511/g.50091  ORF Transcript_34511/g.50091 Transcript_34511/m.50091 type:complete len:429 (-) Transcript_34511:224-1510(-)